MKTETKCRKSVLCEKYPECEGCFGYERPQEAHVSTFRVDQASHYNTSDESGYELKEINKLQGSSKLLILQRDGIGTWRIEQLKEMYGVTSLRKLPGNTLTVITLSDDAIFIGNGEKFFSMTGTNKKLLSREEVLATEPIFG